MPYGPNSYYDYSKEDEYTPSSQLPLSDLNGSFDRMSERELRPPSRDRRNFLQRLQDAFLVQGGAAPRHLNEQNRERQGQALQGFGENPMAAMERYALEDPEGAREMITQYIQQERLARQAAQSAAIRQEANEQRFNYQNTRLQQLEDQAKLRAYDQEQRRNLTRDRYDTLEEHGERRLDLTESDPRRVAPQPRTPAPPRTIQGVVADIEARRARGEQITVGEAILRARYAREEAQRRAGRGGRRTGRNAPSGRRPLVGAGQAQ